MTCSFLFGFNFEFQKRGDREREQQRMIEQGYMGDLDTDVCGDFFEHIDDLLDFPSEDVGAGEMPTFDGCWPLSSDSLPLSAHAPGNGTTHSRCIEDDLPTELSVPCEDIAHLEWLSTFVEDSFSAGSIDYDNESNKGVAAVVPKDESSQFHTSSPVSVLDSTSSSSSDTKTHNKLITPLSPATIVPGRARTKRPRPRPRSPASFPLAEGSSQPQPEPPLSLPPKKAPEKKMKKQPLAVVAAATAGAGEGVRKCMHCQIQKTPQWRMGPMGPKTLCNACGVRYKSGRLYPEYRPAASPTFVASVHSNSHKKVMEMRVKSGDTTPAPTPLFVRKPNPHLLDCA